MKKILISFLIVVVALFTTLEVKAAEDYTVYDDVSNYTSLTPLNQGTKANIIKGLTNLRDISKTELYQTYCAPVDLGLNGNVTVRNKYVYGKDSIEFKNVTTYEDGKLTHISITAGSDLIYDLSISKINGDITINVCKEFHPVDVFKRVEVGAYLGENLEKSYNFDGTESEGATDDFDLVDLGKISFTLLRGGVLHYNSIYEGKDVHMAVEANHAKPIKDLLKNITIHDDTEGKLTDYMVLTTDYKPANGKVKPGNYSLRILAKDSKGNGVVQDITITAIDGTAPQFTLEDIHVDYHEVVTESQVKAKVHVSNTNASKLVISVDLTKYSSYKSQIGKYQYSVTISDEFGNRVTKKAYIFVDDKTAPVIGVKDLTVTYPYTLLSDAEIKKALTATDEIEGSIDSNSAQLNDLDSYRANHDKLGSYRIEATISDRSGNKSKAIINILVVDKDYPEITIGSTIIVSHGEIVSRDRIIDLLKQMGEIPLEVTEVKLSSLYFDSENPSGKYELQVELPDGTSFISTISVDEENNSYDGPIVVPNKGINVPLAVGLSISAAAAIAGTTLFILVYKRKH